MNKQTVITDLTDGSYDLTTQPRVFNGHLTEQQIRGLLVEPTYPQMAVAKLLRDGEQIGFFVSFGHEIDEAPIEIASDPYVQGPRYDATVESAAGQCYIVTWVTTETLPA